MDNTAIVLLAGGEARRFPGKLEFGVAGRPMLAHCYDRMRAAGWPVYIAAKGSFSRALDELLLAPALIDRRPGEGPLSALLSACALIRAERIFAVAADQGGQVMKRYDAVLQGRPGMADRISYVIAPDGKVIYAFASMNPAGHVENTLEAVQRWKASARP